MRHAIDTGSPTKPSSTPPFRGVHPSPSIGHPERDRRINWEAVKTRILSILKQWAERAEPGLSNANVRQIHHFDRQPVNRLIHELEREGQVKIEGYGRGAKYRYIGSDAE